MCWTGCQALFHDTIKEVLHLKDAQDTSLIQTLYWIYFYFSMSEGFQSLSVSSFLKRLTEDDGWNIYNYLMGCWLVKCFSCILCMLARLDCQRKALTGEQRAGYYSLCVLYVGYWVWWQEGGLHMSSDRDEQCLADRAPAESLSCSARC